MTHFNVRSLTICFIFSAGIAFTSCKNKASNNASTSDSSATVTAPAPDTIAAAPVKVATDDALTTGVKDATKDYPGVKADVNNGEVTLTGNIKRSQLQTLMTALNSLRPKKINNHLTVK